MTVEPFRFLHFQFGHGGVWAFSVVRKLMHFEIQSPNTSQNAGFLTNHLLIDYRSNFFFFDLIVRVPIAITSLRPHVTTPRHFSGINYYPCQPCTFSYLFTSNPNPTIQLTGLCHRTWIEKSSLPCRVDLTLADVSFLSRTNVDGPSEGGHISNTSTARY